MMRLRPGAARGRFRNHWLDARFSFSFGGYRDPAFDGWSDLMVFNDDLVAPGAGFAPHPHADVEVMSFPLAGAVEHRDSLGHVARLQPGDVHLMRAGRGIVHSEMNASAIEPEHHLQWWIQPAERGLAPAYARLRTPAADRLGRWQLLAAPDGTDGALPLAQDARVWVAALHAAPLGASLPPGRRIYLHVARGSVRLGDAHLQAGDAAMLEGEAAVELHPGAGETAEVLRFDLR